MRETLKLLLFALMAVVATAQCARNSTDKESIPTFICEANVIVTHLGGCDVQVNETFVLPHGSGSDFIRRLNLFFEVQNISSVVASFNGRGLTPRLNSLSDSVEIYTSTLKSPRPATIKLSYLLKNGAYQENDACSANRNQDLLKWDYRFSDQELDVLRVSFKSNTNNVTVVPGDFEIQRNNDSTATVIARSVTTIFESLAEIGSSNKCKVLEVCEPKSDIPEDSGIRSRKFNPQLWIIVSIAFGVIAFIVICFAVFTRSEGCHVNEAGCYGGGTGFSGGFTGDGGCGGGGCGGGC